MKLSLKIDELLKSKIKFFLIWRIFLFLPVIAGFLINYGTPLTFFEINGYRKLPEILDNPLIKSWNNFDGVHYLNIATRGYINEGRFFPLFSILIFFMSGFNFYWPLTFMEGVIIPNVISLFGFYFLYKLLRIDYSEKVSSEALLYLIFFPTAFFFVCVYSEGLFLLLLTLSFYFARKEDWNKAIFFGFLLSLTRFVGIFIVPALVFEYFFITRKYSPNFFLTPLKIVFLIPLGLLTYSYYNYIKWGNWIHFLTTHSDIGNSRSSTSIVFPLQTVYRYIKILITVPLLKFDFWIALLELSSFIFGLVLLFFAWRKKTRFSYMVFGTLAFLLPALSGTFSGLPRYVIIVFPIFIGLALINSKLFKYLYLIVSVPLLFILLMLFSKGYFVA